MYFFNLIALLALPIVYSDSVSDFRCGDWQLLGDQKCYKVALESVSREAATTSCTSGNGHTYQTELLTIKSKSQQKYVLKYLRDELKVGESAVWLGARRNPKTGSFEWDDGSSILFKNWAQNKPTNNKNKACVQLDPRSGKWTDVECDGQAIAACERTQFWTFPDLQRSYFELRQLLEYKSDELHRVLAVKDDQIGYLTGTVKALEGRVIGLQAQVNRQYSEFSTLINNSLNRLSAEDRRLAADISDIHDTTDRLGDAVYQLHSECEKGCSGGGGGGGDVEAVRRELLAKIETNAKDLENGLKNTVTDVQITGRRQLQILKDGKWKTLGYVH